MGSSGSGKFGNYRVGNGEGASRNGSNANGNGDHGEIECPRVLNNISLEDVAVSEYYQKHNSLPEKNSAVELRNNVYQGRLVVETLDAREVIGNLPTQYNYLTETSQLKNSIRTLKIQY